MFSFEDQEKILKPILERPSNKSCADCGSIAPTWASLDFGVFVCSNCSGAHRALGPTITRVKSTKLDKWQPEWVNNMRIGNNELNQYWEGQHVEALIKKPKVGATLQEYNRYVYDKYIKKKYLKTDPGSMHPLEKLKNGLPLQKDDENELVEQLKVKMEKRGVSEPAVLEANPQPKVEFNLLDEQLPQYENQHQSNSIQSFNPVNTDDEFSEYVSGNENLSTDKNSNISFDELMSQPKLTNHNSQQPIYQTNNLQQPIYQPINNNQPFLSTNNHYHHPIVGYSGQGYNSLGYGNNMQANWRPHTPQNSYQMNNQPGQYQNINLK